MKFRRTRKIFRGKRGVFLSILLVVALPFCLVTAAKNNHPAIMTVSTTKSKPTQGEGKAQSPALTTSDQPGNKAASTPATPTQTPTKTSVPTSTTTPTSPTPNNASSRTALEQKSTWQLSAGNNIQSFLNNSSAYGDNTTPPAQKHFATNYLDTADSNVTSSKNYDSQVNTSDPASKDALSYCQSADTSFHNAILAYRGWAYYELTGDFNNAISAYSYAHSEFVSALQNGQTCIDKREAIQ